MRAAAALAAIAACAAAPVSAGAQTAPTTAQTVTRVALELCPVAMAGTFDMNDAHLLAGYGLEPAPDAFEAAAKPAGTEMAGADLADAQITVGAHSRGCNVMISGSGRIAARDAVIAAVKARDGVMISEQDIDGAHFQEFKMGALSVLSQTAPDAIMISLRPLEKN